MACRGSFRRWTGTDRPADAALDGSTPSASLGIGKPQPARKQETSAASFRRQLCSREEHVSQAVRRLKGTLLASETGECDSQKQGDENQAAPGDRDADGYVKNMKVSAHVHELRLPPAGGAVPYKFCLGQSGIPKPTKHLL